MLNLDFDYVRYLDALAADGLNHTRLFSGTYREVPSSFGITDNTLAPMPGRYAAPWARSTEPGDFDGGTKFDLSRWDSSYFHRLRDFMAEAQKRGVVVEMNLFCPFYEEVLWDANPMNARNNVNGVGKVPRDEVYTLKHADLTAIQEAVDPEARHRAERVRQPLLRGLQRALLRRDHPRVAAPRRDARRGDRGEAPEPAPGVDEHRERHGEDRDAEPPRLHLQLPLRDPARRGGGERPPARRHRRERDGLPRERRLLYRTEGWAFLLAGGGLYNNLDYSFTPAHPDGTFLDYTSPGGGNPTFRKQMRVLKDFVHSFEFVRMRPDRSVVVAPEGLAVQALVEEGRQYAVYLHAPVGDGSFAARWTGRIDPPASGTYRITTVSDDGVRLWLDGKLMIDNWGDHGPTEDQGTVVLTAGRPVEVKVEYYQGAGGATARLKWTRPDGVTEVVPAERLLTPEGSVGLRGEYFEGRSFDEPEAVRVDARLDFEWPPSPRPIPRRTVSRTA